MCICNVCSHETKTRQPRRILASTCSVGGSVCIECLGIESLEAQVIEAQSFLAHLEEHVQELRARKNATHDRLTRGIPLEITTEIFNFFVSGENPVELLGEDVGDGYSPLVLAAVCSKWRRIAFSTTRLWNNLFVYLNKFEDAEPFKNRTQLLIDWLERTGDLPLFLRIFFDETNSNATHHMKNLGQVIGIINRYSARWGELQLQIPYTLIPLLRGDGNGAPMLKCLDIGYPWHDDGKWSHPNGEIFSITNFTTSPLMLVNAFMPLNTILVNWSNIMEVQFNEMTVVEFLTLLRQAPRISKCRVQHIFQHRTSTPFHHSIVHHNSLVDLHLRIVVTNLANLVFQHLVLPALTIFIYDGDPEALTALMVRSAPRLTDFHLYRHSRNSMGSNREVPLQLMQVLPSLETLSIDNGRLPERFFDALSFPQSSSDIQTLPTFLPHLRHFSYSHENPTFRWPSLAKAITARAGMLSGDGKPLLQTMEFVFWEIDKTFPTYYIDKESVRQFLAARDRGIDLRIVNGTTKEDMIDCSQWYHKQRKFLGHV
ncbi:hypothetical protein NLJ89_g3255 [Agrocybe chaxingu]|uniref:F-box domain-containing protein n=1 Tax=Agrocybe chaxingu TaxID=84603 RepID=A0A9W8K5N1_9AGAR|nr:hypothetical protein NLJ89_g3255 [Agrocybe chaxingu]